MKFSKMLMTMAAIGAMSVFGACSSENKPSTDTSISTPESFGSAQDLLTKAWEADADKDKPNVMGGYGEEVVEGVPGAIVLNDLDSVAATYVVPASVLEDAISVAGMMNAMMANYFTAVCMEMPDSAAAKKAAQEISAQVLANQWLCGIPEEYQILSSGNYVISAFGLSDSVKAFMEGAMKVTGTSTLDYSGPIE